MPPVAGHVARFVSPPLEMMKPAKWFSLEKGIVATTKVVVATLTNT